MIKLMSFGLGGNMGYGVHKDGTYTTSWYIHSPEQFLGLIPDHYKPEDVHGCFIVDKRSVLSDRPLLAIKSPMCNASLRDDESERFMDIGIKSDNIILNALSQGNPSQKTMFALAASALVDTNYQGMDFVSPVLYAAWWKKHGARVGTLDAYNKTIEWHD